jgi:predicted aldo/keto reductase-like oxidoreductase
MNYRKLGKTGAEISEISLGTAMLSEQDKKIITATVRKAVDSGINFIDWLGWWPESRDIMGAALDGIRKKIMLSAHLGSTFRKPDPPSQDYVSYIWSSYFKTRDPESCEAAFNDLLSRLHTDYIDILFFSWVDEDDDYENAFDRDGFLGLALRLKKEGKVRFLALSTHRTTIGMKAVQTGLLDAIMFPVNAAHDLFPGDRGLDLMWQKDPYQQLSEEGKGQARDRLEFYLACQQNEVGLIAMKPYAGGLLLREGAVLDFLRGKDFEHPGGLALTPVQCLSYVLSQPGISAALPGCANPKELESALAYFDASEEERDFSAIDANALWKLEQRCVYCNHCLPCPETIAIGSMMRLLDTAEHHHDTGSRAAYRALTKKASDCTQCGICVERCPFGVDVPARMEHAVQVFGV